MSQQLPTAQQHLAALRNLMVSLSPEQRGHANTFWRGVRAALNDQDNEIQRLQGTIGSLTHGPPAVRPHTSQSVTAVRDAVEQVIVGEAQQASDASNTIEEICDLPPQWAMEFIKRQRHVYLCQQNELGCWVSGNVPAHETGYVKMNMRNTQVPGAPPGRKFNSQPWGHQMGIVASGHGPLLRLTSSGEYHVSHLCHDPRCFNPEHLVVEEQSLNKLRNTCHRSFILQCPGGMVVNPCTHWQMGRRLHCILPVRNLTAFGGLYVDMTVAGPTPRTGH